MAESVLIDLCLSIKGKGFDGELTAFAAMTFFACQAQLNCNVRVNALLRSPRPFIRLGTFRVRQGRSGGSLEGGQPSSARPSRVLELTHPAL